MRLTYARRLLVVVRAVDVGKIRERDVWETRRVRQVEQRLYEHLGGCVPDEDGCLALYRAPPYLGDQDVAVRLLERTLPGWDWSVSRRRAREASEWLPFHSDCSSADWLDGDGRPGFASAGGGRPAQAVVAATLRAWILTRGADAWRDGANARSAPAPT